MSYGFLERCQACCTDMPGFAMRSFEDEGVTYYVCLDVEACEARRQARARKPGLIEISYVMTQLNLLTVKVAPEVQLRGT